MTDTFTPQPLTDRQLDFIFTKLGQTPGRLAYYLSGTGIEIETLARNIGCSVYVYKEMALCGLPRDATDIARIAERYGIETQRLEQLFGFCAVPFVSV